MREYEGIVCLPAKENAYEICLRMLFLIWELPGEWLGIGKKHTSSYPLNLKQYKLPGYCRGVSGAWPSVVGKSNVCLYAWHNICLGGAGR